MIKNHVFKDDEVNRVMWKWLQFYDYSLLDTPSGLVLEYLLIDTVPEEITEREVVSRFLDYIADKLENPPNKLNFRGVWECDMETLKNYLSKM